MRDGTPQKHVLTGFPDAAIHFLRALEDNRQRIAHDHGLSAIELRSLFRIAEVGSMTPKQLALDLSLTNGAITGISTRLVASGMLKRVAHPHDRRSLYLELTEAGDTAISAIHTDFTHMVADATGGLGRDAVDITAEALREVTRAIRVRLGDSADSTEGEAAPGRAD